MASKVLLVGTPGYIGEIHTVLARESWLGYDVMGCLVPRDYAGLDRDAVVAGMHSFIEIWSPERWSVERSTLDRDGPAVRDTSYPPGLLSRGVQAAWIRDGPPADPSRRDQHPLLRARPRWQ